MKAKKAAKVTLVGAGPGDPDLITVKGIKALQSADVVLYDALVNPILLESVSEDVLKIYVGKRFANHRYPQEEINMMLVQYALTYGHVVRLKGGDSFVFGRGHEELSFVKSFGIKTAVVPGISSCIAVPELQEVPLTSRGVSESFWVLTGTTKSGTLPKDIQIAAKSSSTIVILMGIRKIRQIAVLFAKAGKANTPAMVVQSGSCANEFSVVGTVSDIVEKVETARIQSPGIIVIGEVVGLHPELNGVLLETELK